jgi:hypothetical protein
MGDSHSEDPPEAGGFLQRVVDGIPFLGSARRTQQPGAATRTSVSSVNAPVPFPNVSFSINHSVSQVSGGQPDPDGPRADTLQVVQTPLLGDRSRTHPNVETRRGSYFDGSFSAHGSVSATIQRQVHHLEQGLDEALRAPG